MTQTRPIRPRDPLDFAPAPSAARHDGWSPERQRRFIVALRSFGNVATAARAVSASATGAYRLRKRPGAEGFAAAWNSALDAARFEQFERLMERAQSEDHPAHAQWPVSRAAHRSRQCRRTRCPRSGGQDRRSAHPDTPVSAFPRKREYGRCSRG